MQSEENKKLEAQYSHQLLSELPGNISEVFYFPKSITHGHDGTIVRIMPKNSPPWIGVFAFGDVPTNDSQVTYVGPGEKQLTILSDGNAYIVNVLKPTNFLQVGIHPVFGAYLALNQNLVIFYSYTKLAAYTENGLLWVTEQISWDGIEIQGVVDDKVIGKSWDAPNDKYVEFKVDLFSGKHEGGAAPPNLNNQI